VAHFALYDPGQYFSTEGHFALSMPRHVLVRVAAAAAGLRNNKRFIT